MLVKGVPGTTFIVTAMQYLMVLNTDMFCKLLIDFIVLFRHFWQSIIYLYHISAFVVNYGISIIIVSYCLITVSATHLC